MDDGNWKGKGERDWESYCWMNFLEYFLFLLLMLMVFMRGLCFDVCWLVSFVNLVVLLLLVVFLCWIFVFLWLLVLVLNEDLFYVWKWRVVLEVDGLGVVGMVWGLKLLLLLEKLDLWFKGGVVWVLFNLGGFCWDYLEVVCWWGLVRFIIGWFIVVRFGWVLVVWMELGCLLGDFILMVVWVLVLVVFVLDFSKCRGCEDSEWCISCSLWVWVLELVGIKVCIW